MPGIVTADLQTRRIAPAALVAAGPACAAGATDSSRCGGGRRDRADEPTDALDGRGDAVARWIRDQRVARNGSIKAWKDARERFGDDPPDLSDASRNSDAVPIVLDAIMTLDGQKLASGEADAVLVVPEATATTIRFAHRPSLPKVDCD